MPLVSEAMLFYPPISLIPVTMNVSSVCATFMNISIFVAAMRVGKQDLCADASNLYSWGAQQTTAQWGKKCSHDCGGGRVKHRRTGRADPPTGYAGELPDSDRSCMDLDFVGVSIFRAGGEGGGGEGDIQHLQIGSRASITGCSDLVFFCSSVYTRWMG